MPNLTMSGVVDLIPLQAIDVNLRKLSFPAGELTADTVTSFRL